MVNQLYGRLHTGYHAIKSKILYTASPFCLVQKYKTWVACLVPATKRKPLLYNTTLRINTFKARYPTCECAQWQRTKTDVGGGQKKNLRPKQTKGPDKYVPVSAGTANWSDVVLYKVSQGRWGKCETLARQLQKKVWNLRWKNYIIVYRTKPVRQTTSQCAPSLSHMA